MFYLLSLLVLSIFSDCITTVNSLVDSVFFIKSKPQGPPEQLISYLYFPKYNLYSNNIKPELFRDYLKRYYSNYYNAELKPLIYLKESVKVKFIGSGSSGSVYLLFKDSGQQLLLKVYSSSSRAKRDLKQLNTINQLLSFAQIPKIKATKNLVLSEAETTLYNDFLYCNNKKELDFILITKDFVKTMDLSEILLSLTDNEKVEVLFYVHSIFQGFVNKLNKSASAKKSGFSDFILEDIGLHNANSIITIKYTKNGKKQEINLVDFNLILENDGTIYIVDPT